MTATATKLPPDPRTIAEMIPVREAEIAARNARPRCHNKGHGVMRPRDLKGQSYQTMWCGVWYDCTAFEGNRRCGSSATWSSRELAAYHGEPYVVDATHSEMWNGTDWVPISEEEAARYWADRIAEIANRRSVQARGAVIAKDVTATTRKRRRATSLH